MVAGIEGGVVEGVVATAAPELERNRKRTRSNW